MSDIDDINRAYQGENAVWPYGKAEAKKLATAGMTYGTDTRKKYEDWVRTGVLPDGRLDSAIELRIKVTGVAAGRDVKRTTLPSGGTSLDLGDFHCYIVCDAGNGEFLLPLTERHFEPLFSELRKRAFGEAT